MFSRRTRWESSSNRLSGILEARRASGAPVIDLTVSNPTLCGFDYPAERILAALSTPESLTYRPDPRGLPSARDAVAAYYRSRGLEVDPAHIFLTASTSESYSLLFRLLCNPEDSVVVPAPSYPLFEYLAEINDAHVAHYLLRHDANRWWIDPDSLAGAAGRSARAILVVDPHNPTGMSPGEEDRRALAAAAAPRGAALIVDEVFCEYRFDRPGGTPGPSGTPGPAGTPWHSDIGLTFLLNGLSKMAGLPQVKLGWIVVLGGKDPVAEASSRLEILNDIYLSAGTPAQAGLAELLEAGGSVRRQIRERIGANFAALREGLDGIAGCRVLPCSGGWNVVVRLPAGREDEEFSEGLLDEAGVYCHPGYFFDFGEENVIVVSLLPPPTEFTAGLRAIGEYLRGEG